MATVRFAELRLELEKLKDLVIPNMDFYKQINDHNNRIKHSKAIHKSYLTRFHKSLLLEVTKSSRFTDLLSSKSNELHLGLHELTLDLIKERKVINASAQVPLNEFYYIHLIDRQFQSSFKRIPDILSKDCKKVFLLMSDIISLQKQDLLSILQMENVSITSKPFQLELFRHLAELSTISLEVLRLDMVQLNQRYNVQYKEFQIQQRVIEEELRASNEFVQCFHREIHDLLENDLMDCLTSFGLKCNNLR